jgi:uncharacterized membrane protein
MKNFFKEKYIHELFDITLVLKGIHALVEIISAVFVYFVSQKFVSSVVVWMTREELLDDPRDLFANYLIKFAESFSVSSQHFVAFYLLSHGIIKMILIVALFKEKLWAYPTSIVVFSMFIFYQIYRYAITQSVWLIVFTVLDIIVILLTIHEYKYIKSKFGITKTS